MANLFSNELKVHNTTPNFRIVFYNLLENFEETNKTSLDIEAGSSYKKMGKLGIKSYFAFSPDNPNKYFSGANVQSYTFTNSLNNIDGSFSITVKEDTRELDTSRNEKYFMDQVQKLDIVEFIENGIKVFYGIVRTISIGATAGTNNKVITISGISASGLLKMFNISTDVISMAQVNTDATNKRISDKISKLFIKNGDEGVKVAEVFRIVYLAMIYIAGGKYYNSSQKKWLDMKGVTPYSSSKAQRLFRFIFGVAHEDIAGTDDYDRNKWSKPVEFLDCDLEFKIQLVCNLFNQSQVNVVSYFEGLLPPMIYEFFHEFDLENNPKIIIREVPFSPEKWKRLPCYTLDPSLITDYTLTNTDTNIFTSFYAYPAGSPASSDTFRKANSSKANDDGTMDSLQIVDGRLVRSYGYIPLDVNFIGYKAKKTDDNDVLLATTKELSERLAGYYKDLESFWSGDITFVNLMKYQSTTTGLRDYRRIDSIIKNITSTMPKVGEKVKLCGLEFYVTSKTHSWHYNDTAKINLKIERGGKYNKDGVFNPAIVWDISPNGEDFIKKRNSYNISSAFSELLTKE